MTYSAWTFEGLIQMNGSTDPVVLAAKETSKQIFSLRDHYSNNPNNTTLLSYSDAILERYSSLPQNSKEIISTIQHYRATVAETPDTTSVMNLYFYSLEAELALLAYNAGIIEDAMYITIRYPTKIQDSVFSPGDTVRVIVDTAITRKSRGRSAVFSEVTCSTLEDSVAITPRVTKFDRFYLLEYYPNRKGKYVIQGNVTFPDDVYKSDLSIFQEFKVR